IAKLKVALDDHNGSVSEAALRSLSGMVYEPFKAESLAQHALGSADPNTRVIAVEILSRPFVQFSRVVGPSYEPLLARAIPMLISAQDDPAPQVRIAATVALCRMRTQLTILRNRRENTLRWAH